MFRRAYRFLYDSPELLKCNINNLDVSFRGNYIVFDYSNVIFGQMECFNSFFLFFSFFLSYSLFLPKIMRNSLQEAFTSQSFQPIVKYLSLFIPEPTTGQCCCQKHVDILPERCAVMIKIKTAFQTNKMRSLST